MNTAINIELSQKIERAQFMNAEVFLETMPSLYVLIKQRQVIAELLSHTNYLEESNNALDTFNYLNKNIEILLGL